MLSLARENPMPLKLLSLQNGAHGPWESWAFLLLGCLEQISEALESDGHRHGLRVRARKVGERG